MTIEWLDGKSRAKPHPAAVLRELLKQKQIVVSAGAYDGMSAVLARDAGFKCLYLSGAALSASMAMPDLGLLTLEDVARRAREIVRASGLPLIVDIDTGFGEAMNVMRTVRELEDVGVACVQIEDQQLPKKCGHLNDKKLVEVDDMVRKVAAARSAASQMVICARTDAAALSFDDALIRAKAYEKAGADVIFVEALTTIDDIRRVRESISSPLLANMTEFGRTPQLSSQEWQAHGYDIVIYPVSAFRVASKAIQNFYGSLQATGSAKDFLPQMMPRAELYEVIKYYDYEALDATIAKTVLWPSNSGGAKT
jgi:methylisocitrate lyase